MLKTLLKNKTFWLLVSIIITVIFGSLYSWVGHEWLFVVGFAGFTYCAVFSLIMIFYGIKNAIKDILE